MIHVNSTCVQVALLISTSKTKIETNFTPNLEHPRLIPHQLFLAVIISEAMCT